MTEITYDPVYMIAGDIAGLGEYLARAIAASGKKCHLLVSFSPRQAPELHHKYCLDMIINEGVKTYLVDSRSQTFDDLLHKMDRPFTLITITDTSFHDHRVLPDLKLRSGVKQSEPLTSCYEIHLDSHQEEIQLVPQSWGARISSPVPIGPWQSPFTPPASWILAEVSQSREEIENSGIAGREIHEKYSFVSLHQLSDWILHTILRKGKISSPAVYRCNQSDIVAMIKHHLRVTLPANGMEIDDILSKMQGRKESCHDLNDTLVELTDWLLNLPHFPKPGWEKRKPDTGKRTKGNMRK